MPKSQTFLLEDTYLDREIGMLMSAENTSQLRRPRPHSILCGIALILLGIGFLFPNNLQAQYREVGRAESPDVLTPILQERTERLRQDIEHWQNKQSNLEMQLHNSETLLTTQQALLNQYQQQIDGRFTEQSNRITDITQVVGVVGTGLSLLITIIVIFFAIRTKNEARLEAQNVAKDEIEKIGNQYKAELKSQAEKAFNQLQDIVREAESRLSKIKETHKETETLNKRLKEQLSDVIKKKVLEPGEDPLSKQPDLKDTLAQEVKNINDKPIEERTFNDWTTLLLHNWAQERYQEALTYAEHSLKTGSTDEQMAQALVNKGVVLGQLQRPEDELAAYEEVIRRMGDRPELPLLERVAKALVNKGITLGQLQRPEEALAAYEEVIRRMGDRPELPLLERVAAALVNKGELFIQQKRFQEARIILHQVIDKFSPIQHQGIQIEVSRARALLTGLGS